MGKIKKLIMTLKNLFVSLGISGSALLPAQVIFQQDFSALDNNAALNGQSTWTNNTSSGGTGGLIAGAEAVAVNTFTLNYNNYGKTKNAVLVKQVDQDGPGSLLGTSINSGTYYISFLANFSGLPTITNYYDVLRMLNGAAFSTSARIWIQPGSTALGFKVGIKIGDSVSPAAITLSDYSLNQTHLFVIKYTINPQSSDDEMKLFVDPDFSLGEPTVATLTAPVSPYEYNTNIDRIVFPWNTPKAGKAVGAVGLVSVARSWTALGFPNTLLATSENTLSSNLKIAFDSGNLIISKPNTEEGKVQIISADGKEVLSFQLSNEKIQKINFSGKPAGVYFLQIENKNGKTVKKFIKK